MKKLLGIVVLGLLLSGNAFAEEIIISCKSTKYKYVNDGSNILVYSTKKIEIKVYGTDGLIMG